MKEIKNNNKLILVGSRVFPFIYNPHDYDFIKLNEGYLNKEEISYIRSLTQKVDIFYVPNLKNNNYITLMFYDKNINKTLDNSLFNIQENKENIKTYLKNNFYRFIQKDSKRAYLIEILLYYLEYDTVDNLPKEEISLINGLHDKNLLPTDFDKWIEKCKKRILSLEP